MPRNFKNQLAGQIGESLVVAELGRLGIVATSFSGNVPDIDLLAYRNGRSIHLQVKAVRSGSVSFDAQRFMKITFDGDHQSIQGPLLDFDAQLIYVFVGISEQAGNDRFFILDQAQLQKIIQTNHQTWLNKHGGVRPKNPQSTHTAVSLSQLAEFENNWQKIEEALTF